MPRRSPFLITLTRDERAALEAKARKYTSPYRDVIRAKIVLVAATGVGNDVIASCLNLPRQIVSKWRKRFFHERPAGLVEAPRGGRPARFPPASSSTNQVEIYFSFVQRKVVTPNDLASLRELEDRLPAFQARYGQTATPFQWTFTRSGTGPAALRQH